MYLCKGKELHSGSRDRFHLSQAKLAKVPADPALDKLLNSFTDKEELEKCLDTSNEATPVKGCNTYVIQSETEKVEKEETFP